MDIITAAKLWVTFKPIKRLKERHRRKKLGVDAIDTEPEISTDTETGMVKEILSLLIRHGLTAGGLAGVISGDDIEMLAGALALVGGLLWSGARKWLRRKREA